MNTDMDLDMDTNTVITSPSTTSQPATSPTTQPGQPLEPFNPCQHLPGARLTSEPIRQFLARLPPAQSPPDAPHGTGSPTQTAAPTPPAAPGREMDVEDVKRVLLAMVEMGLVKPEMQRGIMYKCDAYTYLDIYKGNAYGLRPSIYGSREMLGA
ncbi:hypothetical protein N0V88_006333 [Collariella sp. IMI 366227]|nr:hypothetical protein N0V88_006333 [Collariella sp. IMI 366227]